MRHKSVIFDHHYNEFTYRDGTKMFSQCRHIKGCWNQGGTFAHGVDGLASTDGTITGTNTWKYSSDHVEGHQQEHNDLLAAIRRGDKYNEGWFGATSSMTAVLGRMATYSGKVVTWQQGIASTLDLSPKSYAWDAEPPVLPDAGGYYASAQPGITQAF